MGLATRHLLAGNLDVELPEKKARKKPVRLIPKSLERLRRAGYFAEVVERRLPKVFVTKDLFGLADILAFNEGLDVVFVQTTDGTHVAAHVTKVEEDPKVLETLKAWLRGGRRFEIHGWLKRGPYGERKVYTCRVVEARLGAAGMIEWEEKGDG